MFEILILWLVVAFICLMTGRLVLNCFHYNSWSVSSTMIIGWSIIVVALNVISIFTAINLVVLWGLFVLALFFCVIVTRNNKILEVNKSFVATVVVTLIFFATITFAFIDQEGDTLAYHAQAVRWINEYGVVKGIANLMTKIGFNNSIFCFYALGTSGIIGNRCHSMLGFVLWIFGIYFIEDAYAAIKEREFSVAVYAFAMLSYAIFNAKVGATYLTDYPANLLAGFVLLEWVKENNNREEKIDKQRVLSFVVVVLITIKFSMAILLLLAIEPVVLLAKRKKYRKIFVSSLLCVLAGMPFIIRNIIVSGWILYPSTIIDIVDVEWKVPKWAADLNADWIYSWGRIPEALPQDIVHGELFSWVPTWFENKSLIIKIAILICIGELIFSCVVLVKKILDRKQTKLTWTSKEHVFFVSWFALIYWFCTAPDIRFVIALFLFVLWMPLVKLFDSNIRFLQMVFFAELMVAFPLMLVFLKFVASFDGMHQLLTERQNELSSFDENADEVYMDGVLFYAFDYHGYVPGDHELPCTMLPSGDIKRLGNSLSDGFAAVD